MRAISRLVLVAALLIGFGPATASAQRWTADFGVNGGWSWYSSMVDEGEANSPEDVRFKHGWLTGAQLTVYPWSRLGVRANMTYTDRPLETVGGTELLRHVNLWSGSIDALFRFRAPNETWQGAETLPYVAFGVGGKWTNPAGDPFVCVDRVNSPQQQWECNPFRVPGMTGDTTLALAEQSVVLGLAGLGADFRLSPRTALRLEGTARMYRPQIYRITSGPPGQVDLPFGDRLASEWMTELSATLGLHFLMGLRTPPPVAVAPLPPAPPPPPPPAPTPEPPREDAVTICVIDPTATGGIRMQTATFRHATRDTIVMVGGQAQPLRQVVGTAVPVARDAGWYVRGEPLTVTINRETVRYLPYQTATVIDPARIVYIGNVSGFPVYADRDEIADVLPALQTARGTRTDMELGTLLAGVDARTRDVVQRSAFLYVPMDPYNCVFQPIQRVEDVRKGK
jgi:hypothetical protein